MRSPASGLLALEALADQAQDGHLALGPLDAADALGGEARGPSRRSGTLGVASVIGVPRWGRRPPAGRWGGPG